MTRWFVAISLAASLTACKSGKHAQPPQQAAQLIQAVGAFADRVCACGTDAACAHPIRDDFDAQKSALLGKTLSPADQTSFDAQLLRLRSCGDAAGVTIWLTP